MKTICCLTLLLAACGGHRPFRDTSPPPPPLAIGDPGPPPPPHQPATDPVVRTARTDEKDPTPPPRRTISEDDAVSTVNGALEDAYFAYDRSDLASDALAALRHDAALLCDVLATFPELRIVVEGHCDERGSAEYNLGLGDRRALRAREVLREFGVPAAAVEVVSYGKEAPQCTEPTEACRQKNRRAHIVARR